MSTDLTSVANVKAYLGDVTGTNDALIQKLVTGVSAFALQQMNRATLAQAPYVELYDGPGRDSMLLRQWPVVSITAIEFAGSAGLLPADTTVWPPASGYAVEPTGDGDLGHQALMLFGGRCFPYGRRNVRVTYVAGYAATPADIELACTEMVGEDYKRRSRLGILSQAVNGNETVSYAQRDMPPRAKSTFPNYKRVVPV